MIKFYIALSILLVTSLSLFSQPITYYNNAEGKKGNELKTALHSIISGHVDYSYNTTRYLMDYCDADPENPDNVILIYTQKSRDNDQYGTGGDYINREHVWAKSHGGFADLRPMTSDIHNLHPADASVNVLRSNRDFDNVAPNGTEVSEAPGTWYNTNAWEPSDAVKGQIARAILYMDVRYEGTDGEINLTAVDGTGTYPKAEHGNLGTLLEWNREFPPTDFERRRNERIFNMQLNRNPFVDHPKYADLIWSDTQVPAIQITGISQTPVVPITGQELQVNVSIQATHTISTVTLYWGTSFNSEDHTVTLALNGDNYNGTIYLSNIEGGQYLYYKIVAIDESQNEVSRHFSSFIHKNITSEDLTSLASIQGSGNSSPMTGQTVTIAGRVSKIIDREYYIQNNGTREAICVYSAPQTGAVGDSVVISGTVTEYNNLTEINNINYFCNLKNNQEVSAQEVQISAINEDLEGKLITIKNASFTKAGSEISSSSASYYFSDGTGSFPLYVSYSSKLIGETLPTGTNNVTGILSQYRSSYQLIARDINDINNSTNLTAPEIQNHEKLFTLFPNPVSNGSINVQTTNFNGTDFNITDLSGRIIQKGELKALITPIDVSGLQKGIYILSIQQKAGSFSSEKLLIK